ncbi:hypothetical protein ACFL5V_09400, partial [Fibrobacterota bacterium]
MNIVTKMRVMQRFIIKRPEMLEFRFSNLIDKKLGNLFPIIQKEIMDLCDSYTIEDKVFSQFINKVSIIEQRKRVLLFMKKIIAREIHGDVVMMNAAYLHNSQSNG